MPSKYPKDRFDQIPRGLDRVGAHRAPARRGGGWITFWWALAATILLIAVGIVGLFVLNDRLNFAQPGGPTATATPTAGAATPAPSSPAAAPPSETVAPPAIAPTIDPGLVLTVLNGTPGTGVAAAVADALRTDGWDVADTGDADSEDVPTTTVYYSDPALEGAARGLLGSLASSSPRATLTLSDAYAGSGSDITVVVGNDYVAP
jgi:hypothetical protein